MRKVDPSSSVCAATGQDAMGHQRKQDVPSEHLETLSHCEDDWVLSQVAPRGCGFSILGGIQKPCEYGLL